MLVWYMNVDPMPADLDFVPANRSATRGIICTYGTELLTLPKATSQRLGNMLHDNHTLPRPHLNSIHHSGQMKCSSTPNDRDSEHTDVDSVSETHKKRLNNF